MKSCVLICKDSLKLYSTSSFSFEGNNVAVR